MSACVRGRAEEEEEEKVEEEEEEERRNGQYTWGLGSEKQALGWRASAGAGSLSPAAAPVVALQIASSKESFPYLVFCSRSILQSLVENFDKFCVGVVQKLIHT